MIEADFKAADEIREAVQEDTERYYSRKEAEQFWAAFKRAMIVYERQRAESINEHGYAFMQAGE